MRATLLLLLVILSGCGDKEPLPGIDGKWRRFVPGHPPTTWSIDRGLIRQEVSAGGQVVSTIIIPYTMRGDTMYQGGDLSMAPRRWVTRLIGTDVLELMPVASDQTTLAPMSYWERI